MNHSRKGQRVRITIPVTVEATVADDCGNGVVLDLDLSSVQFGTNGDRTNRDVAVLHAHHAVPKSVRHPFWLHRSQYDLMEAGENDGS